MKKNIILVITALSIFLGVSVPAFAAPNPVIRESVAVCDPNAPTHCIGPDTSGGIPVTISGGGPGEGVITTPSGVTSTDASGSVTTGGTYQTLQASTSTRKGCTVQNPTTATEALSVKVGTTIFTLSPGSVLNCQVGGIVVTNAITVTATTTGHTFSANFQ